MRLCSLRARAWAGRLVVAISLATLVSCGDPRIGRPVYPVKGTVLVNGQPASECRLIFNRTVEDKNPVSPQAMTDEKGEFQLTSYVANDGAPEGEYIVTITWRERSGIAKREFDGPDRLGGAYGSIAQTKSMPGFVVKVERAPLELPPFQLKQSAEVKRRAEEASKRSGIFGGGPIGSSAK